MVHSLLIILDGALNLWGGLGITREFQISQWGNPSFSINHASRDSAKICDVDSVVSDYGAFNKVDAKHLPHPV